MQSTRTADRRRRTDGPRRRPGPRTDRKPTAGARPLITLEAVEKEYRLGKVSYRAVRGVDLEVAAGEMVAVVGPSGSGKTTILNVITGIDRPTAGTVSGSCGRSAPGRGR